MSEVGSGQAALSQGPLAVLQDQLSKTGQALGGLFNGQTAQAYVNGVSQLSASLPSLTVSRIVTIVLGLVMVIGGVLALSRIDGAP